MSRVNERTEVATEQELLEQAVCRLHEVAARLDVDGPVVAGRKASRARIRSLLVEQRLRE